MGKVKMFLIKIRKKLLLIYEVLLIERSGLFDKKWYLKNNPDVATSNTDPFLHYLKFGGFEGRDPGPDFSSSWYLQTYQDVKLAGINPLIHYIRYGKKEGRIIDKNNPYSDEIDPLEFINYYQSGNFAKEIIKYKTLHKNNNKIAVYTVIINRYDSLKIPEKLNPNIDYFCFSDEAINGYGIFQILPIDYYDNDLIKISRFIKTHPHRYFPNYDYCIWVDANILIRNDLSKYINKLIDSNVYMGFIPHPKRNCLYEEAKILMRGNYDNKEIIKDQIRKYKKKGIKRHSGLIETNFFICKHNENIVKDTLDRWWNDINIYSRRDQLSIIPTLNETRVPYIDLFNKGISTRNHPDFQVFLHGKNDLYKKKVNISVSEIKNTKIRNINLTRTSDIDINSVSVDIIICVHNALNEIKLCINSLVPNLPRHYQVIIINDDSEDETNNYLNHLQKENSYIYVVNSRKRLFYTKAANLGLENSISDFKILLNSDTILGKNSVTKIVKEAYKNSRNGIVGPLSNAASYQSIPLIKPPLNSTNTVINDLPNGYSPEDMDKFCEDISRNKPFPLVPLVHGFCLGIKKEVLNRIGYFDEKLFPYGYGEENDFCFRANDSGFDLVISLNTYIYHAKSKSYDEATRINLLQNASKPLIKKYGERRLISATNNLRKNPILESMRKEAILLYEKEESKNGSK